MAQSGRRRLEFVDTEPRGLVHAHAVELIESFFPRRSVEPLAGCPNCDCWYALLLPTQRLQHVAIDANMRVEKTLIKEAGFPTGRNPDKQNHFHYRVADRPKKD